MRWLIGLIGLGVFSQAQSRRAAILLTGHVRTFDLTAPTLDEFLIKANPTYISRCKPKSPVACDVLREWALSVRGLEKYDLQEQYRDVASSSPSYLENCPKATAPVIPAYLRFPRR